MKKIILIHGMSCALDECFGITVKQRLTRHGFEIIEPIFPLNQDITLESWFQTMDTVLDNIDDNTCFLCHSLGCLFVLKYLYARKLSCNTIIAIAGGLGKLTGKIEYLTSFVPTQTEIKYCTQHSQQIYNIYSNNDHILSIDALLNYTNKLKAHGVYIPNKGHFGRSSGVTDIPEIEQILTTIK